MKRLLLALLLLAAPALAQTGDCTAETGTSTAWEILDPNPDRPTIRYVFHAAGLAGVTESVEWRRTGGQDLVAFADSLCELVDGGRLIDEQAEAIARVSDFAPNAGLVQPAYPEPCTPRGAAEDIDECRKQAFHELLIRELYPQGGPNDPDPQRRYQSIIEMAGKFGGVHDWLTTPKPQGGRGLNDNQVEAWLGLTVVPGDFHQRLNNFGAIISSLQTDANNYPNREID